jgi:hypothetical protein
VLKELLAIEREERACSQLKGLLVEVEQPNITQQEAL